MVTPRYHGRSVAVREERKFSGLEELLSTINADIATARAALDTAPFAAAKDAAWLRSQCDAPADDEAAFELIDPAMLESEAAASPGPG